MKKISVLLIIVLLLSAFAGCKPNDAPAGSTAPAESTAAPAESTAPAGSTAAPAESTAAPAESTAAPVESKPEPTGDGGVHPMLFHVTAPNGTEGHSFVRSGGRQNWRF